MSRIERALTGLMGALALQTAMAQPAPRVSAPPVVNYEYDAKGNLTKVVQAKGVVGLDLTATQTYDKLDRVKDATDAKRGRTEFSHDGLDRATTVKDPRGLITQYVRSGLGEVKQLVSPDTGTANSTYDAAGNLLTRTDSRGVLSTYAYDTLNRLKSVVYSKSGCPSQGYGWTFDQTGAGFSNGIGRLTSSSHPAGSAQHSYDPEGRLLVDIQRVNPAAGANGGTVTTTVTYAYDPGGRVASIVYPSGSKLNLQYTGGQLSAISLAPNATFPASLLISQIQWEPFGAMRSWLWHLHAGTQVHERVFDGSGRPVRYRLGPNLRDLRYDAADRITSYTHYAAAGGAAQPGLNQGFGYDELGRITSVTANGASWSISYDANGNRTGVTLNGATSAYNTEATSNRLASTSNPARSFSYDAAGNTTASTAVNPYTADFDLAGRLAMLTKSGVTTTYTVDGQGRRVRKVSSTGQASTVIFVYGQGGQLLGEYDSTGKAIREYVWIGSTPVAVFTPDPATLTGNPIVYTIHTDHLDTPRVVLDKNGAIRWRWLADPFGTTAPETDPSNLGAFTFNLRFPGQYADQESGLFYNYFRDYDASTGRYVESDPIGLDGGINTYSYVGGNPLSRTDPQGLFFDVAGTYTGTSAVATATGTSVGVATAGVAAAGVYGAGIGYVWSQGWKYVTGQSFGGSIYDWVNPGPSMQTPVPTTPAPSTGKSWEQKQKDIDHANYHRTCDQQRPPPNLDPCEEAKWRYRQALSCQRKRSAWEAMWGTPQSKAAHDRALANVKSQLKNAANDIANKCTCPSQ